MKLIFAIVNTLFLTPILLINSVSYAAEPDKWLDTKNEKGFLENRGQMMDADGNAIPNVLFKTEAPNLNIWITTKGMVIQTLNLRKVPKTDAELSQRDEQEEKESGKRKTKNQ